MTADVTIWHAVAALVLGLGAGAGVALLIRRRRSEPRRSARRILLPFTGGAISRRALDSAFRLARAEDAVLIPAYLAAVPMRLALEAPLSLRCETALPLLDSIEALGARYGVEVVSRIEKGRSARHALQTLLQNETFDRVVIPGSASGEGGFSPRDVAWILAHVPSEVLVFRPAAENGKAPAAASALA